MTKPIVTDEMVSRFLAWPLPADFNPDGGITFKRTYNEESRFGAAVHKPTGTNLLDAGQARAMLEHVLALAPVAGGVPAGLAAKVQDLVHGLVDQQAWSDNWWESGLEEILAALASPQSDAAQPASSSAPAVGGLEEMRARKDAAYLERNQVVAALASAFPSGIARTAIEGWSEDWHGCVYIDLPTGQASWHFHDSHAHLFNHLPAYQGAWDGHTTEQKYARLAALAAPAGAAGQDAVDARRWREVEDRFHKAKLSASERIVQDLKLADDFDPCEDSLRELIDAALAAQGDGGTTA